MIDDMKNNSRPSRTVRIWLARIFVSGVFIANLSAAIPFVLYPERFVHSFELNGIPGEVSVRGMGILFLMWNATYPPVIIHPNRYRVLFGVMLLQQVIGLIGESMMWAALPSNHTALGLTGFRFMRFDFYGLIVLLLAFFISQSISSAWRPSADLGNPNTA
jgi:hypothetical protein